MRFKVQLIPTIFLSIVCISGCTSVQPTYTSTGTQGYRVNCGGIFGDGDLGSCYQEAGKACQSQGYRVLQTGVSSMIVECRSDNLNHREQITPNAQ